MPAEMAPLLGSPSQPIASQPGDSPFQNLSPLSVPLTSAVAEILFKSSSLPNPMFQTRPVISESLLISETTPEVLPRPSPSPFQQNPSTVSQPFSKQFNLFSSQSISPILSPALRTSPIPPPRSQIHLVRSIPYTPFFPSRNTVPVSSTQSTPKPRPSILPKSSPTTFLQSVSRTPVLPKPSPQISRSNLPRTISSVSLTVVSKSSPDPSLNSSEKTPGNLPTNSNLISELPTVHPGHVNAPLLETLSRMKTFHGSKVANSSPTDSLERLPIQGQAAQAHANFHRPLSNSHFQSSSETVEGGSNVRAQPLAMPQQHSSMPNKTQSLMLSKLFSPPSVHGQIETLSKHDLAQSKDMFSDHDSPLNHIAVMRNHPKMSHSHLLHGMDNPFSFMNRQHPHQQHQSDITATPTFFSMAPHTNHEIVSPTRQKDSVAEEEASEQGHSMDTSKELFDSITSSSTNLAFVLPPTATKSTKALRISPEQSVFPSGVPVSKPNGESGPLNIKPETSLENSLVARIPSHLPEGIKTTLLIDLLLRLRLYISVDHEPPKFIIT
ncbi:uncharacterized protein [Palaemon carinicauda]|uniref:uncharacterized protein n=1 Tax=Palaemon carinicauda TaxID=392227 RepID=UPI0035B6804F